MKKGVFSHFSPTLQLILLLIIVISSSILVTAVFVAAAIPFTGLEPIMEFMNGGTSVAYLKYLQLVQSIAIFIVPALLAAMLFSAKPRQWLGFFKPEDKAIVLAILSLIAIQPFITWLAEVNSQITLPNSFAALSEWMQASEKASNTLIFQFLDSSNPSAILFNVFLIAIIPALGEEMLFRGSIQPLLAGILKSKHLAVLLTAILFSAMHLQFLTFLPRFVLGVLLGYMLVYGKSIWYPIAAHFTNNALSLIIFYYYRKYKPELNPLEPTPGESSLLLAIFSVILLCVLMYYFRKILATRYKELSS